MRRRITKRKNKTIRAVLISTLIACSGFSAAFFVSMNRIRGTYGERIRMLETRYEAVQQEVYVATETIPAGSPVSRTNTSHTIISSSMDAGIYMDKTDIGKIAVADIAKGQAVCRNMLGTELEYALREAEYAMLTLNTNLKLNDFVDLRIMYPNGENYVVMTKKCVRHLNLGTNECYFWLDEAEIMRMSSAVVDVYLHPGSILYTAKYIEDGQEELQVNYQPSKSVMAAIANDPNIVEDATESLNASVREALEGRLKEMEGEDVSETKNVDLKGTVNKGYSGPYTDDDSGTAESADGAVPETGFGLPEEGKGTGTAEPGNVYGGVENGKGAGDSGIAGTEAGGSSDYLNPTGDIYEDPDASYNRDGEGGNGYVY